MKRSNKKGFTIVELVIVIAIIAVLAAVLIPTFAGVIRKANIAADTQLAKNLNTALAADEAVDGKPDNFTEVLNVFRENGYIVSNLNPTSSNCYFVWEKNTNQIILVDANEDYKVIYYSKELADQTPCSTWHFAVNDVAHKAAILQLGSEGNRPEVIYTPKTADALNKVFKDVYENGGEQMVAIAEDITLGTDFDFLLNKANAKIAIDLGNNTMTTTLASGYSQDIAGRGNDISKSFTQFSAAQGTLNIANGTLAANTNSKFVATAFATGKVFLDNISAKAQSGVVLRVLGASTNPEDARAYMEIANSTIIASGGAGGIEVGSGDAKFIDSTITVLASENASWVSLCIAASYGGVATVESGTYTQKNNLNAVVGFYSSAGTIKINGGTFVNESNANKIFGFYDTQETQTIEITGGTFAGKAFAELTTADAWAKLCGFNSAADATNLTFDGVGTSCVTITLNK